MCNICGSNQLCAQCNLIMYEHNMFEESESEQASTEPKKFVGSGDLTLADLMDMAS